MTEPALWVCARCQTTNSVADTQCVVCDEPHPGLDRGDSTVLYASDPRLAAPGPGIALPIVACAVCGAAVPGDRYFCSQCGTSVGSRAPAGGALPATPVPPTNPLVANPASGTRGESGTVWALVTVFAVLVVLAVVLGAVALSRSPNDSASSPTSLIVDPTTTTTAPPTTEAPTVAPTTVITVPPTTVRASAERAPVGTTSAQLDALDLAQELATALAHDDWGRVRQLEPGKSDLGDAQFAAQYSDLDESTAILVSATDQGGGSYALRLGLVAHQNGSQTSLYCVTWVANTSSGTVAESSAGTRTLVNHGPGTLDPLSQADRLRNEC